MHDTFLSTPDISIVAAGKIPREPTIEDSRIPRDGSIVGMQLPTYLAIRCSSESVNSCLELLTTYRISAFKDSEIVKRIRLIAYIF